jgi:hypothetical protein
MEGEQEDRLSRSSNRSLRGDRPLDCEKMSISNIVQGGRLSHESQNQATTDMTLHQYRHISQIGDRRQEKDRTTMLTLEASPSGKRRCVL